ncbi:beta-aspartyl-peptidase [Alicyclobacillus tolerans]|uniref:Beta-aspartyl-dipeptidase (Metallo-type) n=2 Tax=Alicyclobacillus tolerans TaxID=90970 RepID=A0ABT9LTJ5_9BACL|nr:MULTISPECIES: beta-aspartyl-peptidase [Alicyclobacillus]MDP9727588.1 beta-aspartyl-dipeptidase (metallo-type) [Alicyclobacillus tengchongensis]QRF24017.1 beta-aspartyl-peptidase [Alicyclobacillus sp. TC]SHJ65586.1 beta-aspartyl-dipeptidase (metallo-type) [Alicyclobacillus montanus]
MPVLTLIKNAEVFAPKSLGKKDILLGGRHILAIADDLSMHGSLPELEIVEADGYYAFPGLIDQHVHMAGGGGEGGFHYRTPEISLSHITTAGVTTLVGVLGTDGVTRSTRELLAKAQALDFEGVSTYIYSGAYQVPTRTLTGMPRSDLVLIEKVIGIGEIAISDTRSSHPSEQDLAELASEARVGGLLAGKAGVLHLHVGDDDQKLSILFHLIDKTELPLSTFVPTHLNRNPDLLEDAVRYGKKGGIVDVTSGIRPDKHDHVSVKPSKAIRRLLDAQIRPALITMSSDSNGSSPIFDDRGKLLAMGIGSIKTLWEETVDAIVQEEVPVETAISIVTLHVARILKLQHKGRLKAGLDADILLTDKEYKIQHVFAKGRKVVENGEAIVFGTFENAHDIPGSPQSNDESGEKSEKRGRPMLEPSDEDEDDFPDRDERQAKSRRRHYCC